LNNWFYIFLTKNASQNNFYNLKVAPGAIETFAKPLLVMTPLNERTRHSSVVEVCAGKLYKCQNYFVTHPNWNR